MILITSLFWSVTFDCKTWHKLTEYATGKTAGYRNWMILCQGFWLIGQKLLAHFFSRSVIAPYTVTKNIFGKGFRERSLRSLTHSFKPSMLQHTCLKWTWVNLIEMYKVNIYHVNSFKMSLSTISITCTTVWEPWL